jgi:hypothetical protein
MLNGKIKAEETPNETRQTNGTKRTSYRDNNETTIGIQPHDDGSSSKSDGEPYKNKSLKLPTDSDSDQEKVILGPYLMRMKPIRNVKELMDRCRLSKGQHWLNHYNLATIRIGIGLPLKRTDFLQQPELVDHYKNMYTIVLYMIEKEQERSEYLKLLFKSTPEECNAAVFLLQFFYYCTPIPKNPEWNAVVNILAKSADIGRWCREIIRQDVPDALLESALVQLLKFQFIIHREQQQEYLKTIIFRNAIAKEIGLMGLKVDLETMLGRPHEFMTIANALYFYNAVKLASARKNLNMPRDLRNAFQNALHCCEKPNDMKLVKKVYAQLDNYCHASACWNRTRVECCKFASYCCPDHRDNDWERHRINCDNDKLIALNFDETEESLHEDDLLIVVSEIKTQHEPEASLDLKVNSNHERNVHPLNSSMSRLGTKKDHRRSLLAFGMSMSALKVKEPSAAWKKQNDLLEANPNMVSLNRSTCYINFCVFALLAYLSHPL